MKKVFIDTSVFIRFLTQDDEKEFVNCVKFFELVESGKVHPYTSNIVVLEIIFVLTRLYKYSKKQVLKDIEDALLSLRNLTLIEKSDTRKAIVYFKKLNIKYADCIISTQIPKGTVLATYDKEFGRVKTISVARPVEVVKQHEV